ncbi:hypothetical protein LCGC14_0323510 [marine sediment metagenome]|uniref:Methyltransferase type 11 domain-containing protein n=1 Tax=marine sediment metagenome TaxID=412755 RepID=A0A0F9U1E9_9ZZZZ
MIDKTVADFPSWYHRIRLPDGTVTPGWFPPQNIPDIVDWYELPEDFTGKRVLDVGAFDGFWTFLALERGAEQVVAIEDWSDRIGEYGDERHRPWDTFDFCREALRYASPECQRHTMSVYDVATYSSRQYPGEPDWLASFDTVFLLGVLYHLRHPLLALDAIAKVCKPGAELYVESAVCDQYSPYKPGTPPYDGRCVMEFYPTDQLGKRATNWWAPNLKCLMNMVAAAGFGQVRCNLLTKDPQAPAHCRAMVRAVYTGKPMKAGQVLSVP